MSEGWPDFWIRGKKIDLIDLIDEINTIHTIETINTVTNLGTLNTLNTIGTIQKINPQNTDNVVIDRLKLINLIETINTLETLNTINTVDTINTIDKIKVIHDARIVPNFIQNGSFRTGDLSGWPAYSANVYVEYDSNYRDYVCVFPNQYDYIGQYLPPLYGEETRIKVRYRHEVDGAQMRITLHYTDATSENYDFTASTGGAWYDAVIEPTKKTPLAAIMISNLTDGSELRITGCEMLRKQLVYQAEKDRTITNFPSEYPLPSSQISDLKNVNVQREGTIVHFAKVFSAAGSETIYTPSSGKKARVLGFHMYATEDAIVELRFASSLNRIAGIPAKGTVAMNLVGLTPPTGDTDEAIEIYASAATHVYGWICVEEV